jgi:hypothetical protein
MQKQLT